MNLRFWGEVFWVAVYELGEAVRTRLFQLVLLAYGGGIGGSVWVLSQILLQMEAGLARAMKLPPTEKPGAMLNTLLADGSITDLLAPMVGGEQAAKGLLTQPIPALWAGGAAMLLLPIVLLFTSSGSVSAELKSRSIRYLACRAGRLQIALGKLLGQVFLGGVAAGIGVLVAFTLSMTLIVGNDPLPLLLALSVRSVWAVVYALPYVGIGLAVSQLVANPNGARALGALVFVLLPVLSWLLKEYADTGFVSRLADLGTLFLPNANWGGTWSSDPAVSGAAAGRALVMAVAFFTVGYARFERRDL